MNAKKYSAQAAGMALAAITVWVVKSWGGIDVPSEVAVAFGTVYAIVVSLLTPDSWEE